MINFREANLQDCEKIVRLHAESWQINYRGMWRDDYLNGPVIADRMSVWQKRFEQEDDKRIILLAEEGKDMAGFACSFLDHDAVYGALLDNLHVSSNYKRRGIGKTLMKASAQWVYNQKKDSPFYLWVLEENIPAIKFYKRLGGTIREVVSMPTPYGDYSQTIRIVWPDIKTLL